MDSSRQNRQVDLVEEWRSIPNYPVSNYRVSNTGKVKSVYRVVERVFKSGTVAYQEVPERILSPATTRYGHLQVNLRLDNKGSYRTYYVHELVADAFIGTRPDKHQVCHNDGDPSNNHSWNLRYDTPTGNASDRVFHGTDAIGENNPRAVYNSELIAHVKHLLFEKDLSQTNVSRILNIPYSTVGSVKQGNNWKHVKPKRCDKFPDTIKEVS